MNIMKMTRLSPRLQFLLIACALTAPLAFAQVSSTNIPTPNGTAQAQGQVNITITGNKKLSLAQPDFHMVGSGGQLAALQQTFDGVLWNDLDQSGLVLMVSKSNYPLEQPGSPADLNQANVASWANDPANAQRLVFGNLRQSGNLLVLEGYLYDVTQPASPFMLGKRYTGPATDEEARTMAHMLADAIVEKLGGGPGIFATRIAYISNLSGHDEVWMMDYDGANKTQITHLNSIAYSPRISPGGTKLAFMSYASGTPQIRVYDLITHHYIPFPHFGGTNATPAWSPDGTKLAFASSKTGHMQIYVERVGSMGPPQQLTYSLSENIAPVWNPKTGAQIAFESDRTGLPQIYIMDSDGSNQTRLTDGGYAVSPSWSPNGLSLAFSWRRTGGGENSGSYDVYIMELGSHQYVQLTHNGQRNDFPSWAPDGRHLVLSSGNGNRWQLFTILADGTNPTQITTRGDNQMPNWQPVATQQ